MRHVFVKGCSIILLLIALLSITSSISITVSEEIEVRDRIVFIYAPGLSYVDLVNYLGENHTLVKNSSLTILYPKPPFTSLYYELLFITNGEYSLDTGIPIDYYIEAWNGSKIDPLDVVDQDVIKSLWDSLDTVFIYTRAVDPSVHVRTVNPYINYSTTVIPPSVFLVKAGATVEWSLLNTSIELKVSNRNYTIDIKDYTTVVYAGNESPIITLNVTGNNTVLKNGLYKLRFAVFHVVEDMYLIVTPGTRLSGTGLSNYYKDYGKPLPIGLVLSKEDMLELIKSSDAVKWLVKESINEYTNIVEYVIRKKTKTYMYIYYPFFEEISYLRDHIGSGLYDELMEYAYSKLYGIIDTIMDQLVDAYIDIVSPYTIVEPERIVYVNGESIAPGVIEYDDSIVEDFVNENISFTVDYISGRKVILYTPIDVSVNGGIAIGYGCQLAYPVEEKQVTPIAPADWIIGGSQYVTGFRGYGIKQYISDIRKYREQVTKLEARVHDLNASIRNLEDQIDRLNTTLGNFEAVKLELQDKIDNLTSDIRRLEDERNQVMLYLTTGLASVVVLSIVFVLIIKSASKKKY